VVAMAKEGRQKFYNLNENKEPIPCTIEEWAMGVETAVHVADETVVGCRVSTVFLGLDHNWGEGPPVLFETMVFGGRFDQHQWRYVTWNGAESGHIKVCTALRRDANPIATVKHWTKWLSCKIRRKTYWPELHLEMGQ